MTRVVASLDAASGAANGAPADSTFSVVGDGPLSDAAIEVLASLLIDIAETENEARNRRATFSKETNNAI